MTHQKLLSAEQADKLLITGNKALKFRHYGEAVQALEEFYQGTDAGFKDYYQAQMWLVKAYKGNEQLEKAIALCQQLTNSEQEVTQIWAKQFISTLLPANYSAIESTSQQPEEKINDCKITKKSLNEFKIFCQENLLDDLKELESVRKQTILSVSFVSIIIFIIFCLLVKLFPIEYLIFCFVNQVPLPYFVIFLFLLGFLGCLWGWIAFYTSAIETYTEGFKSKIIQKIFDFINTNKSLNYSSYASEADNEYTLSAFIHSQIFQALLKPNRIQQQECIFGQVNETPIFFSEISTEVELQHRWIKYLTFSQHLKMLRSMMVPPFVVRMVFGFLLPLYSILLVIKLVKSIPYIIVRILRGEQISYRHFDEEIMRNEVSRRTVFKGLFFQADFNKKISGKTIVLPNLLNTNIHALNQNKENLVKLEDPEFSQYFTVYGDDQIEARYVLSTNLMAKLVQFRKKARKNIYVSFVKNMIYIAVEYADDIFEPKLFKKMLSFAPMREYFENIHLMLDIVEDLNLNRHIWGKD
ncbi:putative Galanin [Anabaenopsis circularis NIES-21]|uniref:Putative Galanin n=1 Tax=Anabaenopsis circularis NIES-21 TaxID=1085406 RepID=A0A1Z4GES8_9CYAN|nr:putative Galanin [Anabaenopsis circularis NIES-21]